MSFLNLPNEIILNISEEPSLSLFDLNSLVRTCRSLAALLQDAPTKALFRARCWEPGKRLLCYAADREDHLTVKKLLDGGILDFSPSTPILHHAVETQSIRVVRTLLECGIDADLRDPYQQTPLLRAIEHGRAGVVELLLAQPGVDVNVSDFREQPPLFVAAALGEEKIACLLLENPGTDLSIHNPWGITPLAMAAHMRHEGMVKILLDKTPEVNQCPDGHSTPLIAAIRSGHVGVVSLLLQDNRVNPNARDISLDTPLHHLEYARRAVRARRNFAHISAPSINIYGPLSKNRSRAHPTLEELEDIARILFKDPRMNYQDNSGYGSRGHDIPQLHMAAGCGHVLILKLLLEQSDIDVNAVTPRNSTALHCAAWFKHSEAVELLLSDRRIDPAVRDRFDSAQPVAPLDPVDRGIIELFDGTIELSDDLEDEFLDWVWWDADGALH